MSNSTETPVSHETAAREMIVQFRSLMNSVRGYTWVGPQHRRRISASASLPTPFLLSVAVALDASPPLADASVITAAEIRDVIAFTNAYRPVADELELIARGLKHTIDVKRSHIGTGALHAYRVAKSFSRPADVEQLVPHIDDMRRTLGRMGRGKIVTPRPNPAPDPESTS